MTNKPPETKKRRTPGPAELLARELVRAQARLDKLDAEGNAALGEVQRINALCSAVFAGEMEAEDALRQARGESEAGGGGGEAR